MSAKTKEPKVYMSHEVGDVYRVKFKTTEIDVILKLTEINKDRAEGLLTTANVKPMYYFDVIRTRNNRVDTGGWSQYIDFFDVEGTSPFIVEYMDPSEYPQYYV
jgi:hypothetical protein